jgi:hypothetical protein
MCLVNNLLNAFIKHVKTDFAAGPHMPHASPEINGYLEAPLHEGGREPVAAGAGMQASEEDAMKVLQAT